MGVQIEIQGYDELIKALDRIDDTLSFKLGKDMVRRAAQIVASRAREIVRLGDPKHHPELPALAERIGIEQRYYDGGKRALAIVGPIYQKGGGGGNHGHLLEYGHALRSRGRASKGGKMRPLTRSLGRARPFPFLRPAYDQTKAEQLAAMEAVVAQAVRELGGV